VLSNRLADTRLWISAYILKANVNKLELFLEISKVPGVFIAEIVIELL